MPSLWSSPVRYVECDQQGIVFNAHYLVWADEAVNTWWAAQGVDWVPLNAAGVEYVVVASALQWRSSARWGDTVDVDAGLDALGRTSATVRFTVRVGERVCCEVRTTYVCTVDGAAAPWPDDVRARLSAG
ncbi:acyl-CoA thioesterase [Blastococcus sp. SYSU D00820]